MVRSGMCCAAFAVLAAWAGGGFFTESGPPAAFARDEVKGVDLTALRDAVAAAAKKGENVDEILKALDTFAKTNPQPKAGRVPPELQALRDAVDAAAKKGENVEAITKELVAIEMSVAGRALTRPKPEPRPEPPDPIPPGRLPPRPLPPPDFPFPAFPNPGPGIGGIGGGGIDVETFNKAMELRRKAMELILKDPNDPEARKEAQKLQAEAAELMLKAARGLAGGPNGLGGIPGMPAPFPDRARLGIRLERVPPVAVEQLGLEPNTGIAVSLVQPGSAAEKAGLKVHDIILEFAGKAVSDDTEEFIRRVNAVKVGEKVDLVLLRKGKKVEVKGVELPAAQAFRPPQPAGPPAVDPARPMKLLPLPAPPVPVQPPPAP